VKGQPWFDGPLSFAYSVLVIVRRVPFYNSGMDRPDPAKKPAAQMPICFFHLFLLGSLDNTHTKNNTT
jgi:hypothetical protein